MHWSPVPGPAGLGKIIFCSPQEMSIPSGPGVGGPGIVEPVSLYLERSTGTAELVAHLLEESLERRLLDCYQSTSDLVPCIMLTAETTNWSSGVTIRQ